MGIRMAMKTSNTTNKNDDGSSRMTTGLFSSRSDEWETPDAFFKMLDDEFGFDLDVGATEDNRKCSKYYTIADDALSKPWVGTVWCNPPYSRVSEWLAKAWEASRLDRATVVCLVPARTDTKWWHRYAMAADEVRLVKGRIKFSRPDGTGSSAPFPSALLIYRAREQQEPTLNRSTRGR